MQNAAPSVMEGTGALCVIRQHPHGKVKGGPPALHMDKQLMQRGPHQGPVCFPRDVGKGLAEVLGGSGAGGRGDGQSRPWRSGKPDLGGRRLRSGPCSAERFAIPLRVAVPVVSAAVRCCSVLGMCPVPALWRAPRRQGGRTRAVCPGSQHALQGLKDWL